MAVWIWPGTRQFTRMPYCATSRAIERVAWITAALVAR